MKTLVTIAALVLSIGAADAAWYAQIEHGPDNTEWVRGQNGVTVTHGRGFSSEAACLDYVQRRLLCASEGDIIAYCTAEAPFPPSGKRIAFTVRLPAGYVPPPPGSCGHPGGPFLIEQIGQ